MAGMSDSAFDKQYFRTVETYGTLEYIMLPARKYDVAKGDYVTKEIGYWRITGAQPAIYVNRIFGYRWGASTDTAEVEDNLFSMEHLMWVMLRWPLVIKSPDMWKQRVEELKHMNESKKTIRVLDRVSPSARFTGTLMDFQREDLDFYLKLDGCLINANYMGTGKGVETLAYLATAENTLPAVIVATKSMKEKWKREIDRFMLVEDKFKPPDRSLSNYRLKSPDVCIIDHGKQGELPMSDVYIINYSLLPKRKDDLMRAGPKTLIADEGHHLRHHLTQQYEAFRELCAWPTVKHRILTTGTPVVNRGAEVWSLTELVRPGLLGSHADFTQLYCDKWDRDSVLPEKRHALFEVLRDNIMIRRKLEEVMKDLPSLVRYKERIEVDTNYYKSELRKALARFHSEVGSATTHFQSVRALKDLQNNERLIAGTAKIPAVVEFVENALENIDDEQGVVVYAYHHVVHEALMMKLKKHNPALVMGAISNEKKRWAEIDRFQKERKTRLIIVGLTSGNEGIDLFRGTVCIFAELDWRPPIHRQAEGRLRRKGQTDQVFAYYMEGRGTLDENIVEVLVDKKAEIDAIVDGGNVDDEREYDPVAGQQLLELITRRAQNSKQ